MLSDIGVSATNDGVGLVEATGLSGVGSSSIRTTLGFELKYSPLCLFDCGFTGVKTAS
jgi:hypothetical protein